MPVHPTAAGGFASSANYEKVRSGYTRESVEFLLRKVDLIGDDGQVKKAEGSSNPVTLLELGSGTGKFTRVMLDVLKDQPVRVIASDPLESMCKQFQELLPDVELMKCPAQNIALPSSSVDIVLAAQSFTGSPLPKLWRKSTECWFPEGDWRSYLNCRTSRKSLGLRKYIPFISACIISILCQT